MLNYEQIMHARDLGNIFIDPFDIKFLGANSYDVRLGNWFFNLAGYQNKLPHYQCFYIPDGEYVEIPRHGTLLAMTIERIGSKFDLVPQMKTRSTIERMGIDVCKSAGLGDIGYYNQHWTMEISACIPWNSPEPAVLKVGDRVAQIHFEQSGKTYHSYSGQYNEHEWPLCMLPKVIRKEWENVDFIPEHFPFTGYL